MKASQTPKLGLAEAMRNLKARPSASRKGETRRSTLWSNPSTTPWRRSRRWLRAW